MRHKPDFLPDKPLCAVNDKDDKEHVGGKQAVQRLGMGRGADRNPELGSQPAVQVQVRPRLGRNDVGHGDGLVKHGLLAAKVSGQQEHDEPRRAGAQDSVEEVDVWSELGVSRLTALAQDPALGTEKKLKLVGTEQTPNKTHKSSKHARQRHTRISFSARAGCLTQLWSRSCAGLWARTSCFHVRQMTSRPMRSP